MAVFVDKKYSVSNELLLEIPYRTDIPSLKAFNLKLAATRVYKAGEKEDARNLVAEALNCYPPFHPHRIHTLEQLIRYHQ